MGSVRHAGFGQKIATKVQLHGLSHPPAPAAQRRKKERWQKLLFSARKKEKGEKKQLPTKQKMERKKRLYGQLQEKPKSKTYQKYEEHILRNNNCMAVHI